MYWKTVQRTNSSHLCFGVNSCRNVPTFSFFLGTRTLAVASSVTLAHLSSRQLELVTWKMIMVGFPPMKSTALFLTIIIWLQSWLLLSCSFMSNSFETSWTVAHQALLSMGFPKLDYWSGLPFPSLEDLPNPGIEPMPPTLAGGFPTTEPPGKPKLFSHGANSKTHKTNSNTHY